jgi:butyryl-CoA dehydrogenase
MFIMMNAARFAVGMQGIAIAERAYQKAVAFARERVQGRDVVGSSGPVPIINHPDVRRMLLAMRSRTEAARALAYVAASAFDAAHHDPDPDACRKHQSFYEFLVPIVKGWSTELSIEVASEGVQVHGGMGFIEETGAAQYYRDARILTIYEGTTAIQANDLVSRKTMRDGGATARAILSEVRACAGELTQSEDADLKAIGVSLGRAGEALGRAVEFVLANYKSDIRAAFGGSVPYLKLAGITLGGWQMGRAALSARSHLADASGDAAFYSAKVATARFFADHCLTQASGLSDAIVEGSKNLFVLANEAF